MLKLVVMETSVWNMHPPVVVEGDVLEPEYGLPPPGGDVVPLPGVPGQVVQLQHLAHGPAHRPGSLGSAVGPGQGDYYNPVNAAVQTKFRKTGENEGMLAQ